MEKDILIILMFAFGIVAVIMFILFYVYLKRFYNKRRLDDSYEKDIDNDQDDEIEPFGEEVSNNPDMLNNEEINENVATYSPNLDSFNENVSTDQNNTGEYESSTDNEDEFMPVKK